MYAAPFLFLLMLVTAYSPAPERPNPREALKLAEVKVEKILSLESLELTSKADAKEWTYTLTFNRKPDCPESFGYTGSILCLVDHVEKAEPAVDFRVKGDGKKVMMTVAADKAPKKPLVRKIERVKGEKLVTYEVTFESEPTEEQVGGTGQFFVQMLPRPLILEGKDRDKEWKFRMHTTYTEGEKTARYAYEAYIARTD